MIASAKDRNITLLTFGKSTVNINDINLLDVSIRVSLERIKMSKLTSQSKWKQTHLNSQFYDCQAHDAAQIVENWENGHLLIMTKDLNRIVAAVEGPNGLQRRLRNLELGVDTNFTGRPGRSKGNRV